MNSRYNKVILSYDIVYAYLYQKRTANDIKQLIELLHNMTANIYIDAYSNLLLYLDGLLRSPNTHAIKGSFILPLIGEKEIKKSERLYILSLAQELEEDKKFLLYDSSMDKERRLFLQMGRFSQLYYLRNGIVNCIVSNDWNFHALSYSYGLNKYVYNTESFIERVHLDNPDMSLRHDVRIEKMKFGDIKLNQRFFNSYRDEYKEFNSWFLKKKSHGDEAYIVKLENQIVAFLALKIENESEDYSDIFPLMKPCRRLKICSFKVELCGYRIGERFMKIVFQAALQNHVDEIYVTAFDKFDNRRRLIDLLCNRWGFIDFGFNKRKEHVLTRNFNKYCSDKFRQCFPFAKCPDYAVLMPLTPGNIQKFSHGAIRQNLILKNIFEKPLMRGNVILFTNEKNGAFVFAGIIEDVISKFDNEEDFIARSSKRSILNEEDLRKMWLCEKSQGLLIIKFLYNYEFTTIDSLLLQSRYNQTCKNDFVINKKEFCQLIKGTQYEKDIIVN